MQVFQDMLRKVKEYHDEEMRHIIDISDRLKSFEEELKKRKPLMYSESTEGIWDSAEGQELTADLQKLGINKIPVETRKELIELDKAICTDPKNFIPRIVRCAILISYKNLFINPFFYMRIKI